MVLKSRGKFSDSEVLGMNVEDSGCWSGNRLNDRISGIADVQERSKLLTAKDRDRAGRRARERHRVYCKVEPRPRESVSQPIESCETKDESVRASQFLFRIDLRLGVKRARAKLGGFRKNDPTVEVCP
jgi:hypothetical protein